MWCGKIGDMISGKGCLLVFCSFSNFLFRVCMAGEHRCWLAILGLCQSPLESGHPIPSPFDEFCDKLGEAPFPFLVSLLFLITTF